MPNWVSNNLTVTGDVDMLELFKQRISSPYQLVVEKYEANKPTVRVPEVIEPVFSFWNIVKPPKDKLGLYHSSANGKEDKVWNWYHWNVTNWGVKWDASDAEITNDTETEISYRFETPWGSASQVIELASRLYPELKFNLDYEEEQGWGAEINYTNGKVEVVREWDIPNSHADYEALDRSGSCACKWSDDPTDWYADCPKDVS